MLTLYQFPVSHYCEKARWALDFKRADYRLKNLIPGLHVKKTKKLAPKSSVPILVNQGQVVQYSGEIINYLDQAIPEHPLTPSDERLRQEAAEWEQFADREIGIPVRRLTYHTLLDHEAILVPAFTQGGPFYGRFIVKAMFPKMQALMRKYMDINETTARESQQQIDRALDQILEHRQDRAFMVGEQFSRADLSLAALLAPLIRAPKFGVAWPEAFPEPLESVCQGFADRLTWVTQLYADYR